MDSEASTSHIDVLERLMLDESAVPTNLSLSLLQDITNHFSSDNEIGSGGFAVVYKGVVGKDMVAVKKLSNPIGIHENKFQEEVKCLIKARHKNIVRFLGYCADTQGKMAEYEGNLVMADQRNWLLCFEYVCNGSLDKHITGPSYGLNWRERYRIIRGICDGLLFLHEKRIVHLDLKPTNILLDGHMVPKIADFGLSRCLSQAQTRAITQNICGTPGYMGPEYITSGQITFASDIYSLGVITMEILTGVKQYLEDEHIVERWMNRLGVSEGDMQLEQVRVCTEIAIRCMESDPKKRPVASHIIDMLDRMEGKTGIKNSLTELQVILPKEQSEERFGNLTAKSLQKGDVEKHLEIIEYVAENLGRLHFQEGQQKVGQLSVEQDTMENFNHHGSRNTSFIYNRFNELNILDIYNRKAPIIFNRIDRATLEQSHLIKIFRKDELMPILKSSNRIGECGSTKVYKGVVDNALVVVKKTFDVQNKQLENELIIQSQIIHKNITWLIGCCLEMDSPILVYEFLPRGSLHDILHSGKKVPLNLDVRLNIIAESAQGLAYLHSQARTKILHGDLKSASILLDDNFVPKISEFGMSRLIMGDSHHTRFIGDETYMDPVYLQTGLLTEKSDVYSFGIVILELISRKKASHTNGAGLVRDFIEFHKEGKKATELFDKEIAITGGLEILDRLAEIAVECLDLDVEQRPTMTDVAERLLILNRSRRLEERHRSAHYSERAKISTSFVEHRKVGDLPSQGVQDINYHGTSSSSFVSTLFHNLNNLDIFNCKARMNFNRKNMHTLEKSHFIKFFTKEDLKPILRSNNFIGQGAFAVNYRCVVDNALVMVKKLINNNGTDLNLFRKELLIQSQVIHKNIIRLIGCCLESETRVLVYEFLPRGSLEDILGNMVPLNLDVRLNIIAESAQGLAYLHSQAHTEILHGGVKPANILLDDNFIPKISDIGVSRLITRDKEDARIIRGTRNYIDPTYRTELLGEKSDVYSFGVVILELISGKRPTHFANNRIVRSFLEVQEKGNKATELYDKEIAVTAGDLELLDCLAEIGVECVNPVFDQRPTMTEIAERLLVLNRSRRSKLVSH